MEEPPISCASRTDGAVETFTNVFEDTNGIDAKHAVGDKKNLTTDSMGKFLKFSLL